MIKVLSYLFLVSLASAKLLEHAPLPYADTALEPHISQTTLQTHHGKHHAKYVNTANSMMQGTKYEAKDIEDIIKEVYAETQDESLDAKARAASQGLFNNVAQSWNHAFYWKCMKPNGGGIPSGVLLEKIKENFGSFEEFKKQFAEAGNTAFGSGWAWLVYNYYDKKMSVTKTIGAGNPMTAPGQIPILTMDVWEHAYYLDYKNLRNVYVDTFLEKLVNWEYVAENLNRVLESGRGAEL